MIDPRNLESLFGYDPETGEITRKSGAKAFTTSDTHGYLQGRVNGVLMLAHRVAWALHYKKWPENQVDHINGCRTDNRLCNLRSANQVENARNAKRRKDNTSGAVGVCWHPRNKKWMARISANGRQRTLGYFASIEDAKAARKDAEREHGYHKNHGRAA